MLLSSTILRKHIRTDSESHSIYRVSSIHISSLNIYTTLIEELM